MQPNNDQRKQINEMMSYFNLKYFAVVRRESHRLSRDEHIFSVMIV